MLLTVSALSACGFHLRGNYLVPQEISSISLTSFDQFSQLTRDVDAQLRLNDIELVPPSASIPNLHLVNESVGERTLSLYQNSKAAEIELTYTTSYRVTIPDVGSKTFTTNATRNYLDNPRAALAKSVERDLIVDEMRKQTATQIMRQLARLKAEIDSGFTQFDPIEEQPSAANSANQ
nr:LPS assembly lipoprotein LptE [Vibrio sp. 99-8-1]